MPGSSQQKMKLIALQKIFLSESDEDHPLTAVDLIRELARYGVEAERKSVYHDVELLAESGMDILKARRPRQGYFLAQRDFELAEVRLLMDAVQSAAFITPRKTKELLEKLERLMSRHQARDMRRQVYIDSRVKCGNEQIYYTIDCVHRAIQAEKQISFYYYRREVGRGRSVRHEGKPFVVSPYAMIWANDHYYLVANLPKYDDLTHFRLDRMERVEMLDEPRRSFEEVSEYRGDFDAADYACKCFGMFTGEPELVELRCANALLEEVVDRFGEEVPVFKDDGEHFRVAVKAHVSEGFVSWILQFGGQVEALSPEHLRMRIRQRLEGTLQLYKHEQGMDYRA